MAIISKEDFYKDVSHLKCSQLLHPWTESCLRACFDLTLDTVKGSIKFYIPIYLIKIIMSNRKINKQYLLVQVRNYIRSVFFVTVYGFLLMATLCATRNLCGRYYYYSLACFGGFVCGSSIYFESHFNKTLTTIIWANLSIEFVIQYLKKLGIIGKNNNFIWTVCFMVSCSVMTHLMVKRNLKKNLLSLWFFTPSYVDLQQMNTVDSCLHENSCLGYILNGASKYYLIGFSLQTLKTLVPKFGSVLRRPYFLRELLLRRKNFQMGIFFSSFITIFRVINCFYRGKRKPEVAGLLSGLSCVLKNDLPTVISSFTTMLQYLLYPFSKILEEKYKIPYIELIFMICNGFLVHARFLNPEECPKYIINTLNTATNGKAEEIFQSALKWSTNINLGEEYFRLKGVKKN